MRAYYIDGYDEFHEYVYDALGRRIAKTVDDVITRYLYAQDRVVEERDGATDAVVLASYVYGRHVDEVLSMRRDVAGDGTAEDYFYLVDAQFNVGRVTDSAGLIVESYRYGDFGAPAFFDGAGVTHTVSKIGNPYLFTGRRYDDETGYYYYRARYMDPLLGRFISRDPLGAWGDPANHGNPYSYAGNNPWGAVDPFGLMSEELKSIRDHINSLDWDPLSYNEKIEALLYFGDLLEGSGVELESGTLTQLTLGVYDLQYDYGENWSVDEISSWDFIDKIYTGSWNPAENVSYSAYIELVDLSVSANASLSLNTFAVGFSPTDGVTYSWGWAPEVIGASFSVSGPVADLAGPDWITPYVGWKDLGGGVSLGGTGTASIGWGMGLPAGIATDWFGMAEDLQN